MRILRQSQLRRIFSPKVVNTTLAFLILFSIILNSFVPKGIGNREVVIQIISAVANNFVVKAVKVCTEDLMSVSNKVAEGLRQFLKMSEPGATAPINNESKDNETPANTASDAGIVIASRDISEKIKAYIEESTPIIATGKVAEQLYKLYCNLKICGDVGSNIGILSFILFILIIERRKFWAVINEFAVKANVKKGKANLC